MCIRDRKALKEAQAALDLVTLKKYSDLSTADIRALVLDDKWFKTIAYRMSGEVNSLTLDLVSRIQELGERYAETVDQLEKELRRLNSKVEKHLAAMGVK